MSSCAFARIVNDGILFRLLSELSFKDSIAPLLKHISNLENLVDMVFRIKNEYPKDICLVYFILEMPESSRSVSDYFDDAFPREFLDKHLMFSTLLDGVLVKSSFVPSGETPFEVKFQFFGRELDAEQIERDECQHEFESTKEVISNALFLDLAVKHQLMGGSWLLHVYDQNRRTRAKIPDAVQKSTSIMLVRGIVLLLKNDQLDRRAFKSFEWKRCVNNKQITYLVKITNKYTNYFNFYSFMKRTWSEIFYFNKDLQVSAMYRALSPLFNRDLFSVNYKADVVSACNLNRRSSTNNFILCLFPSLTHANMMLMDSQRLLEAYRNSDVDETRFGDPKKVRVFGFPRLL